MYIGMLETVLSPGVVREFICCRPSDWDLLTGFVQKSDWFSRLFQDKITYFSRFFEAFLFIFMLTKTLQNFLLNAEIFYTMYSPILNTEWNSNLEL